DDVAMLRNIERTRPLVVGGLEIVVVIVVLLVAVVLFERAVRERRLTLPDGAELERAAASGLTLGATLRSLFPRGSARRHAPRGGGGGTDVIAIVGPTASGKSALAMRVAERIGGEIVSADSRQVYRGMDIGTAKPTIEERARIPHHLVDIVDPGERYDVLRYQRDGRAALAAIRGRGRLALVVGGTGLYVRALLDGLDLSALPHDPGLRVELEREDPGALYERLRAIDPDAASG